MTQPGAPAVAYGAPYGVAYDVDRVVLPGWPHAVVGLLVGAVGLLLLRAAARAGRGARVTRAAGTTLAVFGAFGALVVGGGVYAQHARLRAALRAGTYAVVEGVVYDRPPSAPAGERAWVVEGADRAHWYRYDASPLAVGYRRAGPGQGGLRDGTRVRLADVGGRIARVDTAAAR